MDLNEYIANISTENILTIIEVEKCTCKTPIHIKINSHDFCIRELRPYVHSK